MKKLVISLLVSTLVSSAIAAESNQWNHWSIGADAIWLKPSGTGSSDIYGSFIQVPNADTNRFLLKNINPNYQPGYIINLGYQPCPCNDFKLSYLRLHTHNSNSFGPLFDFEDTFDSANGKLTIDLDQIDLTAGRMANFNPIISAHFFGGLRYSNLSYKLIANTSFINLIDPTVSGVISSSVKSNFWGIGPLGGIDGTWWIFNNVGLTGLLDGALLVGKPHFNTLDITTDVEGETEIDKATTNTKHQVVPVFTAKLGGVYSRQFISKFGVKVEAGYQVMHYANVFSSFNSSSSTVTTTDQNFDGPYFGATLSFA